MSARFDKIFFLLYSLLFSLTPLIIYHQTSELFEFNKMLFIYLMTVLILALWLSKMIINKRIIIKKTFFDLPILLFLASQILSTIFSIDRHTSFFGYYGRFNGGLLSITSYIILYYAFVSNFNRSDLKKIFGISLLASFVVILWGLPGKFGYDLTCFIFSGNLNNQCWTEQFKPAQRMFSTLGQPNWLGAYLIVNLFIAFYFFYQEKKKFQMGRLFAIKPQFLYGLYIVLNFSAVLLTRSRSALGASLLALTLLFIYIWLKKRQFLAKTAIIFLLLLLGVFVFRTGIERIDKYLLPLALSKNAYAAKVNQSSDLPPAVTESFQIRKIVWQGAVELGLKYPLFGTGVETFAFSYYFTRPVSHNLTSEWDFLYNKAHNEYLNYFATTGFLGLGAYLFFVASVLFIGVRKILTSEKKSKTGEENLGSINSSIANYQLLISLLLLSYITILITNFFGFSITVVNLYFYLLPAFLVKVVLPDDKQEVAGDSSLKALLIFPLLLMVGGFWFVLNYFLADINYSLGKNYRQILEYPKAYLYLSRALSFRSDPVYQDELSRVLANLAFLSAYEDGAEQSQELYRLAELYNLKSLQASAKNVLFWKTRAQNYVIFYQIDNRLDLSKEEAFQEANQALEQAKKLSPTDPKIYYSQAMLYLTRLEESDDLGEDQPTEKLKDEMLENINQAIELKSNYRDAYFAKGLILKRIGRVEEAKEAFQYILDYINPNDEEVKKEWGEI